MTSSVSAGRVSTDNLVTDVQFDHFRSRNCWGLPGSPPRGLIRASVVKSGIHELICRQQELPRATSGERCCCSWQKGWTSWTLKVASNLKHSVIYRAVQNFHSCSSQWLCCEVVCCLQAEIAWGAPGPPRAVMTKCTQTLSYVPAGAWISCLNPSSYLNATDLELCSGFHVC